MSLLPLGNRKELPIHPVYHKSGRVSAAGLTGAVQPLPMSAALSALVPKPGAWGSHDTSVLPGLCHVQGASESTSQLAAHPHIFCSSLGDAGWEEASVNIGFACSCHVCSLVINIVDLKFFLESGLSSQNSFNSVLVRILVVISCQLIFILRTNAGLEVEECGCHACCCCKGDAAAHLKPPFPCPQTCLSTI